MPVAPIPSFEEARLRSLRSLRLLDIAEEELRRSEARYRLIAEHTTDLIIQADLDSTRIYVSPSSLHLLGYEPEELLGTRAFEMLHSEDKEPFRKFLNELKSGARERGLTRQRYQHKDGPYIWCETTYKTLKDPLTGLLVGYVASIRDISERHAAAQRAAYLATHDSLTGLPNRTHFHECLEHAISSAKEHGTPFALLWLDLDRFKFINDSFGHPFGDRILCEIGNRIRLVVGGQDVVARIGGDEFAILQREVSSAHHTLSLACRIIDAVNKPFEAGGNLLNVGASAGIVTAPEDGYDTDELFRKADVALYRAKASGRKSVCFFTPEMDVADRNRLTFEIEFRDAIADEKLFLEYQPIVNIETNSIVACEALLRWRHPSRGLISPSEFIPIAEETGLIIALGAWVLHEACREVASWSCDITVAINVSACQFLKPGLEESVTSALGQSGLSASRLVLEITESVLIRDSDAVLASLRRLHASGVKISLDDFGTGYSSLSYVHQFPFDKIKIDRSFVQAMRERGASTIVGLVAELGRQLDMTVVAEGVETQEQLDQVRVAGCREYQGYLFSKSMTGSQFKALMSMKSAEAAAC